MTVLKQLIQSVIDWSMTVLRHQYCQNLWPYVIDSSQRHKIYGHLSLTAVNDRNLWPNLPKSVIDRGQWQKKVSLTGCILYMDTPGTSPPLALCSWHWSWEVLSPRKLPWSALFFTMQRLHSVSMQFFFLQNVSASVDRWMDLWHFIVIINSYNTLQI